MTTETNGQTVRRYLTPIEQADAVNLLRQHWEDLGMRSVYGKEKRAGRYKDGYSDERIAHELSVSVSQVSSLRRRYFGFERWGEPKEGGDPGKRARVTALEQQLKALTELAAGLTERVVQLEGRAGQVLGEA